VFGWVGGGRGGAPPQVSGGTGAVAPEVSERQRASVVR